MRRLTTVVGVVLAFGLVSAPNATAASDATHQTITMLATTDMHGNVESWDYFKNAAYTDKAGNAIGLIRVASIVDKVRAEQGADHVIVVDNGDTLQGSSLDYFFAAKRPVTVAGMHPMAVAYNTIEYDAQNIGNHEFNYGIPLLQKYASQLNLPLLGANVVDASSGEPVFTPYTMVKRTLAGKPVTVGVLGLTTPGSNLWDVANLKAANVKVTDMVAAAKIWVPKVRAAGADVVVVLSHAGVGNSSSYEPAIAKEIGQENASDAIAMEVPGIDVMVIGHSHRDVPQSYVTNKESGKQVLLTQPKNWGIGVSSVKLDLVQADGKWKLAATPTATAIYGKSVADSAAVHSAIVRQHETAITYVNQVIAQSLKPLSAADSRWKDTEILDYIQMVQTETVTKALAGSEYAKLPVLSIAAPFSRTAVFPQGDVTIRDMAGLYIYDNTLEARILTGAEVKAYLEYSNKYFAQVPAGGKFDANTMTGAGNTPDYNLDVMSGIKYQVDLTQPVGSRIKNLTMPDGSPVSDTAKFVIAVNNYRASGGGGFPGIAKAQVVYNDLAEIRQLLIDWAVAHRTIDPAEFFVDNWTLTIGSTPVS